MNSSEPDALKAGLDPEKIPAHVAVIMDGNGRWAKKLLLNRVRGHEKGADTVRNIVRTSRELGIRVLTLYAFSTENWQRPRAEVDALMGLLRRFLTSEKQEMAENNIRLNTIGQTGRLPGSVQKALSDTMAHTAGNDGMTLNLALSYGGRAEIVQAARRVAMLAARGDMEPDNITEEIFAQGLYTVGMPDPDLVIRTSGEMRISNFLLWQLAYSEIFVTDTLWPDFTREEYIQILKAFQNRNRRYGGVRES